jgi:hypothetical protein
MNQTTLEGNDLHNAEIALRRTANMENREAWREIGSFLAEAGYRGPYLQAVRDGIWSLRRSTVG